MASYLSSLLLLVSVLISTASSQLPELNVWPMPQKVSWPVPHATTLSPSFQILAPYAHAHLRRAVRRYNLLALTERHRFVSPHLNNLSTNSSLPPLKSLYVAVRDVWAPLEHGVDETYALAVTTGGMANLTAGTAWGAMRGLETFTQLVRGARLAVPAGVYIEDWPLLAHRGVMLDTARNYFPVRDIMRTIRAMGANKLNVFHWHITDEQSFPLVLPSAPELATKGSYGPGMQYWPSDVRRIVEFGMRHGVRVVPEIDGPAHAGSWAAAYPEIVTCANKFWLPAGAEWPDRLATEPGTGQLNPLNPATYDVLRRVFSDAASLFPDLFYHAGGDEVIPACWKSDPAIAAFLADGGTLDQLLETFVNSTYPLIRSHNRTVVYWEDVLLDAAVKVRAAVLPPATTILQTWNNGPANTKRIVSAGYRAIVSSADFYYLDCGRGGFLGNDSRYDRQDGDEAGSPPFNYAGGSGGSWCAPYKTWQRVYDYDVTHGLTAEEAARVVGAEVVLWSEQADEAALDALLWPRAAAAAEAWWSGNRDGEGRKRYAEATDRINEWRHRMVARGIRAEAIQPLLCLHHPRMCNLVY